MQIAAIVPVAGSGKRFAAAVPKQFLEIAGQPVVAICIQKILQLAHISRIVVVGAADNLDLLHTITAKISGFNQKGSIVAGGKERQDSVYNGLQALAPDTDIVLVHDGVRPLVTTEIIEDSIQVAGRDGACIAAVPVKDTIKRVYKNRVQETLNRAELWQVQTPQTARYQWLMAAHTAARGQNFYSTDEAALLEWHGYPVTVINGDYNNIKITTPEDLAIARVLYQEV